MALLRPHHRVPGGPAQAATPSQRAKTSLSAVFRFKGGCEGGGACGRIGPDQLVIYLDHNATTPIGPEVLVQAGIPAVKQAAASLRN